MAKKKTTSTTPVDSIRHKDKRKNIPTEELRDFVRDDEEAPKTMLYPRDPQLVWKGKDEHDRQDLAVPVVPIYIQEKIHPQAIIEDLRERYGQQLPDWHSGGLGKPALRKMSTTFRECARICRFSGQWRDAAKKMRGESMGNALRMRYFSEAM